MSKRFRGGFAEIISTKPTNAEKFVGHHFGTIKTNSRTFAVYTSVREKWKQISTIKSVIFKSIFMVVILMCNALATSAGTITSKKNDARLSMAIGINRLLIIAILLSVEYIR